MNYSDKLSFLSSVFGKYKYHSNTHEAEFFSPFCSHHKPKLSVNLESDRWRCWISGKCGNKLIFPMKQAGASREQLQKYISSYNASGTVISNRYLEGVYKPSFPFSFVALENCKNSFVGKQAYNYLESRGISKNDILRYKIGIATEGSHADRIIFPSFDQKGDLNFYTGRSYRGDYLNIIDVPKGYKNSIILNELNVDWDKPVILTEGFIDMLKSGVVNTIPLFNSLLHDDSLLWETIVLKCKEVVMALDPDAWKKQDAICKKFSSYDVNVSVMQIKKKDLGEGSKEENLALYENRVPWSAESSFLHRVRAL